MRQSESKHLPRGRHITEDTAPVHLFTDESTEELPFLPREVDTDPGIFQNGEGNDLVFRSVEQEDTAPRNVPKNQDDWQVMELADVDLPREKPANGEKDGNKRWLLGGPPYPVENEDGDIFQKPTRRGGRELTPTELALISDSDVKIIEPENAEPLDDGPTDPGPKKKKKKPK
jgi:hypothetical protein